VAKVADEGGVNSLAWSPDSRILAGAKTLWRADGSWLNVLNGQGDQFRQCGLVA
jgi:hypothetical protein